METINNKDKVVRNNAQMEIELLNYTPNPELTVATAARQCYSSKSAAELSKTMTNEQIASVIETVSSSGHLSTFEHVVYMFGVAGVSRALTHQLVRHRLASYEQQSQRYVTQTNGFPFVTPPSIAEDNNTAEIFAETMSTIAATYDKLVEAGVPAEDARFVLPNACETKIVVTMNARELLHLFKLRCCNRAQWEIRGMADKMLELVYPTAPLLFGDAGAPCAHGKCPEGEMTCGHPRKAMNNR